MISAALFADDTSVATGGIGLVAREGDTTGEWYDVSGSFERVHIAAPLLCVGADIESVTLRSRSHWSFVGAARREYWLEFTLGREAAERINECSRRVPDARLVLVLRGQVVRQMVLAGSVTGSRLAWHGFSDKGGAETLVREIETMLHQSRRQGAATQ